MEAKVINKLGIRIANLEIEKAQIEANAEAQLQALQTEIAELKAKITELENGKGGKK